MADDFVAQTPGNPFRAGAPKQNSFVDVDNAKARGQIFEDGATDFRVIECGHEGARKSPRLWQLSAKIHRTSQGSGDGLGPKPLYFEPHTGVALLGYT